VITSLEALLNPAGGLARSTAAKLLVS